MNLEEILGIAGLAAAVVAWTADRRRMRRSDLDKVGWMPWTSLFFWALMASVILLALTAKAWVAP